MATFFLDNDISFRIVDALRALVNPADGDFLISLRDKFPQDAKDSDWIPEVGSLGWIVISRDFNQRRRGPEKEALRKANLTILYVRQSASASELYSDAARIIKCWPKIAIWGRSATPGTLAKLDTQDKIVELRG